MRSKPRAGDPLDSEPQNPIEDLQRLADERDQLRDQLLRTMAEFQNYRRRQEEQRGELERFATERFVKQLLPVLDNFERALGAFEERGDQEAMREGLRAVDRQLRQVLEGQNVSRIPSVGEEFNPDVHEALAIAQSDEHEDNTVIDEIEAGYKMGERVIRPARVRVSKRP